MDMQYTPAFETTGGKVRGYYQEDGVMVFKGVPYAEPPVGALRWKPAEPVQYREGVRDCVAFGSSAWQNPLDVFSKRIWTEEFLITNRDYSEDCLTLNLWTREGGTDMPVILYFYGGGFVSGGSSCEIYDGESFAKNGVIYITFNHREGVLAWLANDDLCRESGTGLAGNYMLSDAFTALRWIKENIARFGGDPDNITVWGQSAGASQVNLLQVSPAAKELFSRTVSMGYHSYLMREWKTLAEVCAEGNALEEKLGGSMEKLRELPAEDFLPYFTGCRPAIDGYYINDQFKECVKNGQCGDKPFMIGFTAEDGRILPWSGMIYACKDIEAFRALIKAHFPQSAADIERIYVKDEKDIKAAGRLIVRDMLLKSVLDFAKAAVKARPDSEIYIYIFNHVMPGPISDTLGAFHSFEVPYFTNHLSDLRKDYWTDADRSLGVKINAELSHYAKYGRPLSPDFKKTDGSNLYIINTDEQHNEVIPDERYEELCYLFGQD